MSFTHLGSEAIAERLFRFDKTYTPCPAGEAFGEKQLQQFHRDGFVAVEGLFSPAEVRSAQQAISRLIALGAPASDASSRVARPAGSSDGAALASSGFEDSTSHTLQIYMEPAADGREIPPEGREPYVRKLHYFVDIEPALAAISDQPLFRRIVEQIVGSQTHLIQDMALLKPPHIGREKPWHQDTAYFNWEPLEGVLGTWIALDAATAENGCMHVIPGSHRAGPQPHYHDRDCQLADEDVQVERDVMVPLQPGGALFFSGLLHHATPPNFSDDRRRALQFHYASIHCRRIDGQRHAQMFFDDRGYAGCSRAQTGLADRPIATRP
jgi:phytanoyl-CoA hydroxylase